ncbi:MAG TPA: RagB/SusD family nutrient uptake outer membrane protein, partial [Chryseosolibacter sp.]|nr:RagB/SusD family nutrient uptake outer membrane protein [Chryseosolibacter sp.]
MKIFQCVAFASSLALASGCEDFLDEKSVSDVTTDSYVVDEAGMEDLVKACYPLLREMVSVQGRESLVMRGTDIFTGGGWKDASKTTGPVLDLYDVRLNSAMGDLALFWDILYSEIGRTNTVLARAPEISYVHAGKKAARIGEAKFLRALSYFYLVQTWGDVPMPL